MRLADIFRLRLRSLFSRAGVEQELDEELRYHLDRQIEEYIAAGMSPAAARLAALRAISGLEQSKEECRDMRGLNLIDNLRKDLRFAIRQLHKNPGFTVHRHLRAGPGHVRQPGDLRVCGCGSHQAAALPRSRPAGWPFTRPTRCSR